jgi:hypothetical protein
MLESVIGPPEAEDDEEPMPKSMGDPVAAKKRALRSFFAAAGIKGANVDKAAEAFAAAVDACLEYESPE